MGEAKRKKEAGAVPERERFEPCLIGPIVTSAGPILYELDRSGRVFLRPLSTRRIRIHDENIIEAVRNSGRSGDAVEVETDEGRAADSKGNRRADEEEPAEVPS